MLKLTLVTPEKKFVTDLEVKEVVVPGARGELNILPGHAPLVTTLNTGVLKYQPKNSREVVKAVVSWGYCEVCPDKVLILAETVDMKDQIDQIRAKKALKTSENKLRVGDLGPEDIVKYQRKIKRSLERIHLSKS